MIGFVSALSSSLAVIILIMAVMLINMVKSAQNEQVPTSENIASADMEEDPEDTGQVASEDIDGRIVLSPNVISVSTLNYIASIDDLEKITVYCTYGNAFSQDVAKTYTTFNSIATNKKFPDIQIETREPVLELARDNRCYVEYNKK